MTDWLPPPDDDLDQKTPAPITYTPGTATPIDGATLEEPTEDLHIPEIDDPANHHRLPTWIRNLPLPHTPTPPRARGQLVESLTAPWAVGARWAGVAWRWHLPGGQVAWLPVGWVWRWRKTAALLATALVLSGRVTVRNLVVLAVAWLATAMAINAPAASRSRLASLQRMSAYRKRRRRLRSRRVRKMWANADLVRASKERGEPKRYPKIRRRRPHPLGVVCRVDASGPGYGVDDFQSAAGAIAATLKARTVKVRRIESWWHRGDTLLTIIWADPFPRTITTVDLDGAVGAVRERWERREWWRTRVLPWVANPIPAVLRPEVRAVAVNDERVPVGLHVRRPVLVAAVSGAGKSSLGWSLLWALRRLWLEEGLPTLVSAYDPKRMELARLRGAAWRYHNRNHLWGRFVAEESAALEADQESAARAGLQDVPWDGTHFFRLLLVDELVTALMSKGGQAAKIPAFGMERTIAEAFAVLMSQMRAANRSMVAMTQDLREEVLGPARNMFAVTAVGIQSQTGKSTVDIAFGSGGHQAYPAHQLDVNNPRHLGRFWVKEGGLVEYVRVVHLTPRQMDQVTDWVGEMSELARSRGVVDPEPPAKPAGGTAARRAPARKAAPRKGVARSEPEEGAA